MLLLLSSPFLASALYIGGGSVGLLLIIIVVVLGGLALVLAYEVNRLRASREACVQQLAECNGAYTTCQDWIKARGKQERER